MKFSEFRDWLKDRGGNPNSVNTRSQAVRKIEQELVKLGSPHQDLDDAFDADAFVQLRLILDDLRSDARQGGSKFRILFPNSKDPLERIKNSKAWLGQYAQFRRAKLQASELHPNSNYWFVGASFGRTDDQTDRFLKEGIWEISSPKPTESDQVRLMQVGDSIAIKAAFVRKNGLPFDNGGRTASVMRIKARGVITENPGNGEQVSVLWDTEFEPRDWYFYTYRPTIWQVQAGTDFANALIRFAFQDESQDYSFFLNHGSWALPEENHQASRRYWLEKTLIEKRPDRQNGEHALGSALWSPQTATNGYKIYTTMLEVEPGDVIFHLIDNRTIVGVSIAAGNADENFVGLPDTPWAGQPAYRIALEGYETLNPALPREAFLATEPFQSELLELRVSGAKKLFYNIKLDLNEGSYLTELTPTLRSILNRAYVDFCGKNLPYLTAEESKLNSITANSFSLDDAMESLFIKRDTAEDLLVLWKAKKNLILQGPPGVGKSFAAHLLAYSLMEAEDHARIGFVQFHQSYSYEDFVEGYRPTETGFELRAGKFVEFCRQAEADPNHTYVFIVDEINRGNLSKILGELMLLIESDKRDSKWAMPLASGRTKFHVPKNVYLLGLMNTADRSLAVVDYALRRRFAFVDLAPNLGSDKFRDHLLSNGITEDVVSKVVDGITLLNATIVNDTVNLGPGFAIGHSYFCGIPVEGESPENWYERIIRTEIGPQLREYWFDAPEKADEWIAQLLTAA